MASATTVKSSGATRLLATLAAVQAALLVAAWSGRDFVPQATAQVPDPGEQRLRQLAELEAMNAKLERVIELLESGTIEVRVEQDAGRSR